MTFVCVCVRVRVMRWFASNVRAYPFPDPDADAALIEIVPPFFTSSFHWGDALQTNMFERPGW